MLPKDERRYDKRAQALAAYIKRESAHFRALARKSSMEVAHRLGSWVTELDVIFLANQAIAVELIRNAHPRRTTFHRTDLRSYVGAALVVSLDAMERSGRYPWLGPSGELNWDERYQRLYLVHEEWLLLFDPFTKVPDLPSPLREIAERIPRSYRDVVVAEIVAAMEASCGDVDVDVESVVRAVGSVPRDVAAYEVGGDTRDPQTCAFWYMRQSTLEELEGRHRPQLFVDALGVVRVGRRQLRDILRSGSRAHGQRTRPLADPGKVVANDDDGAEEAAELSAASTSAAVDQRESLTRLTDLANVEVLELLEILRSIQREARLGSVRSAVAAHLIGVAGATPCAVDGWVPLDRGWQTTLARELGVSPQSVSKAFLEIRMRLK